MRGVLKNALFVIPANLVLAKAGSGDPVISSTSGFPLEFTPAEAGAGMTFFNSPMRMISRGGQPGQK